jgi:hypothetical protein
VVRVTQPAGPKRSEAIGGARRPQAIGARAAIVRLQRSAGNRAVGHVLQRKQGAISVRKGSKLSAAEFLDALKRNKNVPRWLTKALASKGESLVLSGRIKAPDDRIWQFVDPLAEAFKAGDWEITTARSTIKVTKGSGKERKWRQVVTPDLPKGEQIGSWNKTGPDETTFSPSILHSESAEVIYGWTSPNEASNKDKRKRNLIVIVTEIEVTAPNGKTKVFTPDADNVAEAILHEIGIHAGRISQGLPDTHDETSAVIREIVDQVGEFFRPSDASGELKRSHTTDEIFAFVDAP